ncbi:BrnA antitoxin family protein [Alkalimonas sp.]|uniref:BrnA antitoxin family protein n=1 Tax=Alkalimonas sp. TaxID=1872453 RepID=UPI00263BCC7B|nr:BrnA antitoxin family protein [Alkalimonas sp.]MCC5827248.1 BrnA antitoxin family protein [Alkalimonas sp.]
MATANKPLTTPDGELREDLSDEELARFRPAEEVLPASFMARLKKGGRPVSDNPKILTTVRFDAEVINAFKATGKGWQTRMNNALKEWLATHSQ